MDKPDKREPELLAIAKQLVKDFDVLYRVAEATLHIETLDESRKTRHALRSQIDRLRPAFDQVQTLKAVIRGRN